MLKCHWDQSNQIYWSQFPNRSFLIFRQRENFTFLLSSLRNCVSITKKIGLSVSLLLRGGGSCDSQKGQVFSEQSHVMCINKEHVQILQSLLFLSHYSTPNWLHCLTFQNLTQLLKFKHGLPKIRLIALLKMLKVHTIIQQIDPVDFRARCISWSATHEIWKRKSFIILAWRL